MVVSYATSTNTTPTPTTVTTTRTTITTTSLYTVLLLRLLLLLLVFLAPSAVSSHAIMSSTARAYIMYTCATLLLHLLS